MKSFFKPLSVLFLFFCLFGGTSFGEKILPRNMVVTAPVADVRHKPRKTRKLSYKKLDWHQTTQLLFGEKIVVFEERDGWLRIGAKEQSIFVNGKWYWCLGWIRADQAAEVSDFPEYNLIVKEPWANIKSSKFKNFKVSMGTKLRGVKAGKNKWKVLIPHKNSVLGYISDSCVNVPCKMKKWKKDKLRESIVKTGQRFLGTPYFWGGGSFYNRKLRKYGRQLTGVDCSGFVNLCYKVHGIVLPRNSVSQYRKCKRVVSDLKPADLIFLAHWRNPSSITHVMMYAGNGMLIEARGSNVRKVVQASVQERLGRSIDKLKNGDVVKEGYTIYFGRYIS